MVSTIVINSLMLQIATCTISTNGVGHENKRIMHLVLHLFSIITNSVMSERLQVPVGEPYTNHCRVLYGHDAPSPSFVTVLCFLINSINTGQCMTGAKNLLSCASCA